MLDCIILFTDGHEMRFQRLARETGLWSKIPFWRLAQNLHPYLLRKVYGSQNGSFFMRGFDAKRVSIRFANLP